MPFYHFHLQTGNWGLERSRLIDAQGHARAEPALKVWSTLQPELSILVRLAARSYS